MRSRSGVARALAAVAAVAASVGACGDDEPAGTGTTEEVRIVATHSILGDIVRNVVGGAAVVDVVIPAGADPHEFQPSARDVETITDADLVVANGLDFEVGLLDALAAAEDAGATVFEMASPTATPVGDGDSDDHADDRTDDVHTADDEGSEDPHVWFDPLRMATSVEALGAELAELDPGGDWAQRAKRYADEIRAVDAEVRAILSTVPPERRILVTNHESLRYFARRYGFDIAGAAIPSPTTAAESSAAGLAALAEVIAAERIPAVFADASAPDDLARSLAADSGIDVQVVTLLTESLAEPGEEGDNYLDLLRVNARRIADALRREH